MPNYGDPKYWDKRYKESENDTFDWLEDYSSLKPLISDIVKKDAKILVLGCGNAELSEKMYDDGYENIDNIDISSVVIDQMRARSKGRKKMTYEVMDVCDLKYKDSTYDLVIDKSTIDALLCGEQSFYNVAVMIKETQRVLKVGGYYIVISYGKPENRVFHMERDHLSFDLMQYTIAAEEEESKEESEHYIYLCKKRPDADSKCEKNWAKVSETLKKAEEEEEIEGEENSIESDELVPEPIPPKK